MTAPQVLPVIGGRPVHPSASEKGHWFWLSSFGWHHCTPKEDEAINAAQAESEVQS